MKERLYRRGVPAFGSRKIVQGVGINDAPYAIRNADVWCPFYQVWLGMMKRCYDGRDPAYADCTVDPRWFSFMAFRGWMIEQDWRDKVLDKDILTDGNRIYSPETCMFIPQNLNGFMKVRGPVSIFGRGVGKHPNGRFFAKISTNEKRIYIGAFDTPASPPDWSIFCGASCSSLSLLSSLPVPLPTDR